MLRLLVVLLTAFNITVVDPGHFHASLVQKFPLEGVSDTVFVYAPKGPELDSYLAAVEEFNTRSENPTHWVEQVYAGDDFLEKLPQGGDFVVLAGNNAHKTDYILEAVRKGYNVLSDKPLAIDSDGYRKLRKAYSIAQKKGLVILDLMTERYDTLNIAARQIIADPQMFGTPVSASLESIHHFCKMVSGKPTRRPQWYYDVTQQGEGIADVTTHLIDILFWQCFPGCALKPSDVKNLTASHYPTVITPEQFEMSTGAVVDAPFEVNSNGEMSFRIKGMDVKLAVRWDFVAPAGGGDTYQAVIVGTRGTVRFVQDATTGYVRELFYRPAGGEEEQIIIPSGERLGHEDHFNKVATSFLDYICRRREVPRWEVPNTITKYYITTTAVREANRR